ncbi:MAG: hypothetical protein Q9224_007266 [Gallowayella concinna]
MMPPRRELPFAMRPTGSAVTKQVPSETNEEETLPQVAKKQTSRAKAKPKKQPSRPTTSEEPAKPASSLETTKKQISRPTSSKAAARPESRPGNAKGKPLVVNLKTRGATATQRTQTTTKHELSTLSTGRHQMLTSTAPDEQPSTSHSMLHPSSLPLVSSPNQLAREDPPRATLPGVPNPNSLASNGIVSSSTITDTLPSKPVPVVNNIENFSEEEYFARLDQWVQKYHEAIPGPAPNPTTIPATTDAEQLAAYAAQPEKLRLEVLDKMICECLADPNFEKLMEDVEKSWRRVGLGF